MKYSDQIIENKAFNFFKKLLFNIAISLIILMGVALILIYCFDFKFCKVLSGSQEPVFYAGDLTVAKPADEYRVGDIIMFDQTANKTFPTSHRIIAIMESNGTTYYFCHGDAVESANPKDERLPAPWKDDRDYVLSQINEGKSLSQVQKACRNVQVVNEKDVYGVVITHFSGLGRFFDFIKTKEFIILLAGFVVVLYSVNNEIEMRKGWRTM